MKKAIVTVTLIFLMSGCAEFLQVAKTVTPVILDIATQLCRLAATEHGEENLGGMTIAEYCECAENLEPFIAAAEDAKSSGAQAAGFSQK